jgi:glycerol-3-phosphate dehydrogenase
MVHDVLAHAADRPELLEPLPGAADYLKVEVVYGVREEGALHLEDVLTRRTRISIEYPHRGLDAAEAVADLMADALGWNAEQIAREIAVYTERVTAERDSQTKPDDQAADEIRSAATEARRLISEPVS